MAVFTLHWHSRSQHIVIKKPSKSVTLFYNYKQTFSVALMIIVDTHYKFIKIDIGSMGRLSDANMFSSGALAKKLNKQTLRLPSRAGLKAVQAVQRHRAPRIEKPRGLWSVANINYRV